MNRNSVSEESKATLIAFSAWLRQIGRSDTTGWRWAKAGWLHPFNVAGRPYLTAEDIEQFQRRALAGEFAKVPSGAARKSSEERAARTTDSAKQIAMEEIL